MNDWPHQRRGVASTIAAIAAGENHICVTSPTGGGKSRIMVRLIEHFGGAIIYVNRAILFDQFCRTLYSAGIHFGSLASGYAEDIAAPVQLCSVQTVDKRLASWKIGLPEAPLVIVDEIHNEAQARMVKLIEAHVAKGAAFVGFTATPIGVGHICDRLIVAGTTSELRSCGALLPAHTYAPDEIDYRAFKSQTANVLAVREKMKARINQTLFGRVVEHYRAFNPEGRPALLFAGGIPESQWFAESLTAEGIPAAHIDGQKIWADGRSMQSTRENREALRQASESGEIKVVCNRFVMREGVDWPHLYHGIFACSFGSVSSYLQAGGRLLRAHPSIDRVIIQDHGGNWWRHDSLNADRIWDLGDDDQTLRKKHARKYRGDGGEDKGQEQPRVCGACSKVRNKGDVCPFCGHVNKRPRRAVIQTSGKLATVYGDVWKPKRVSTAPTAHRDWIACVFRAKNAGRTFNQARAMFEKEHRGETPDESFPCFPLDELDWPRKVRDVRFSRLTPYKKPEPIAP